MPPPPPTCWARNLCWPCRGGWPNRCGCPGVGGGALGRPVAAVEHGGRGDGGRGNAAIVGQPDIGLLAAAEMGADLSRLAVIPDPGTDPVEVAAVLVDGMDLVVLGLGGRRVPPTRARAVVARARSKGCTLLVTGGDWQGAPTRLAARVCGYEVTPAQWGKTAPGSGASAGCGCRSAGCARDGGWRPRRGRGEFRW
ncbi:hypothetical protein I549_1661 [Mycobacterium avium subsp. avium 2285 (R)]|nr:hypothetical protein I549_1661 [Mycobacterium avium subsp. avium 2285 (R)]